MYKNDTRLAHVYIRTERESSLLQINYNTFLSKRIIINNQILAHYLTNDIFRGNFVSKLS